ncbi:hypothetical protein EC957_002384 [Mortierella hygrophila]|uniref:PB1 domain-containing protein n=1 Tax=Mortierella hygrophila TaxID=979708 RepID=A0A9P6F4J7_9FUNG|nr:hypothetical protein EC957_002384 [Mortierella hygrophila]
MAGLKYELDQWNEGVIAFDQGLYEDALEIFEPIADSAKIHFNIGVVLTTLGDFEGASAAFTRATSLDQFLAIAYFQNGVANVALEDYGKALSCFHDAFLYLRGNMVIDYTQLGLDFKLYSCQVLFNRALCYLELGEHDLAMTDMWRATREKQIKAHDLLDQALRDKGQNCTVFTVPQGVLYRPAESKVKNAKKKDYLGNSKVIAALDAKDAHAGFQGKSAWQVQMSGPTNVAAVEEPRPMTPPVAGLQRRATERASGSMGMNGRARRGTDPEQRPHLEHSASFSGIDNKSRRGQAANNTSLPGPSLLRSGSTAGAEARLSLLSRRNTDNQRPARLNLGSSSNLKKGGPASAAPSIPLPALPLAPIPTVDILSVNAAAKADADADAAAAALREFYQDDMVDDLDQHVYALSIEAQEITIVDKPSTTFPTSKAPSNTSSTDIRVSPTPTRSNSGASKKGGILRKASQNSGYSSSFSSPPMPSSILPHQPTNNSDYTGTSPPSRTGTPPVFSDLRRMGSNGKNGTTGLWRGDSVRSTTSGGSGGSGGAYFQQQQPNHGDHYLGSMNGAEGAYLHEPVYAGLRNKLRVKCHYIDTRAVLVRADTPLEELIQRIQEKFQVDRPLKLRYRDEDQHMLSMVDDDDWLMAQQVHMETTGSLDRIELWCFDEE